MTWVKRTFSLSARKVNSMLHSEMIPYNVARTHHIEIVPWIEWIPKSGTQVGGPCAWGKNSFEEIGIESCDKCSDFALQYSC